MSKPRSEQPRPGQPQEDTHSTPEPVDNRQETPPPFETEFLDLLAEFYNLQAWHQLDVSQIFGTAQSTQSLPGTRYHFPSPSEEGLHELARQIQQHLDLDNQLSAAELRDLFSQELDALLTAKIKEKLTQLTHQPRKATTILMEDEFASLLSQLHLGEPYPLSIFALGPHDSAQLWISTAVVLDDSQAVDEQYQDKGLESLGFVSFTWKVLEKLGTRNPEKLLRILATIQKLQQETGAIVNYLGILGKRED